MTMEIINLTPHTVNVWNVEGTEKLSDLPPSGNVARVEVARTLAGEVAGLPVFVQQRGEVTGLPAFVQGSYLLVSAQVRLALPERTDLLSPGELLRNEQGQPVGCKGLDGNSGFFVLSKGDMESVKFFGIAAAGITSRAQWEAELKAARAELYACAALAQTDPAAAAEKFPKFYDFVVRWFAPRTAKYDSLRLYAPGHALHAAHSFYQSKDQPFEEGDSAPAEGDIVFSQGCDEPEYGHSVQWARYIPANWK